MLTDLVGALILAVGSLPSTLPTLTFADVAQPRAAAIALLPSAAFRSVDRAVTNWRQQAALQLDVPPLEAVRTFAGADPRGTSRCVRLNNYWCIKRAGWSGEIAADSEGHVAFATALDGATVAAILLRRYYLDYRRHSALAIVSHWAPASCGGPVRVASPRPGGSARPSLRATADAPHGLGNTLRARFLAGHTRAGLRRVAGRSAPSMRRTIIADRSLAMMPAPEIAVGMGEHLTVVAPRREAGGGGSKPIGIANLTLAAPSVSLPGPGASGPACAADAGRIRAYATQAIAGIAGTVDDDLDLFAPDGTARPNLARLMSNMAHVEIGPLAVRGDLVAAAIDRAQRQGIRAAGTGG